MRREHYENNNKIELINEDSRKTKDMLNGVLKKQSLNDTGMATLFKINQITAAMEG